MNNDVLKKYESKYSFLTRILKNFDDINNVKHLEIEHFFNIYLKHKNDLSNYHLNYAQYENFKSLYTAIKQITQEDDLIPEIEDSEVIDGWYVIKSNSFKETQKLGLDTWCITRSEKLWDDYNLGKSHYILINQKDRNDRIGISFNENKISIFDKNNQEILKEIFIRLYPNISKKLDINKQCDMISSIVTANIIIHFVMSFQFLYLISEESFSILKYDSIGFFIATIGLLMVSEANVERVDKTQKIAFFFLFIFNVGLFISYIGSTTQITLMLLVNFYLLCRFFYVHFIKKY